MQADFSMRFTPSVPFGSDHHQATEQELRAEAQPVRYHGELGELASLFYKNLALTILSLGFYRFWGKTQTRRYLWSHIEILGERLEYTGTGTELLLGFLKSLIIVAVPAAAIYSFAFVYGGEPYGSWGIFLFGLLVFGPFYLAAQFAAQRYRLSRTQWRGIRGHMVGSAWRYSLKSSCIFIVVILTAGLMTAWWRMRCLDWRIKAAGFGVLDASLAPARAVCARELAMGASAVMGISLLQTTILDIAGPVAWQVGVSTWLLAITPAAFLLYFMSVQQQVLTHLQLKNPAVGDISFESSLTSFELEFAAFRWIALLIFTLGLAWPYVLHRAVSMTTENLRVKSRLNMEFLAQSAVANPRASEGLLEALAPGIL